MGILHCVRYEKAAQFVADRLHREIRAATLKHLVTFRAKHPDDLRGKLRKKAADPRYSFERLWSAMDTVVTDLAGCRILLCDPADEERVAEIVRRVLPLRVDLPGHDERHRKPSGYRATHLLVGIPESAETLSSQNTVCEVQLTTLAAHVFNELEHDVIYKDHGVPPLDEEREAAANLRDLSMLLDRIAGGALRLRARTVTSTDRAIRDPNDLRYVLEQTMGRPLRGDFVRLFRLLSSVVEPLFPKPLGNIPERMQEGARFAAELGLPEEDDVVRFVLGMFRERPSEFREQVSS